MWEDQKDQVRERGKVGGVPGKGRAPGSVLRGSHTKREKKNRYRIVPHRRREGSQACLPQAGEKPAEAKKEAAPCFQEKGRLRTFLTGGKEKRTGTMSQSNLSAPKRDYCPDIL